MSIFRPRFDSSFLFFRNFVFSRRLREQRRARQGEGELGAQTFIITINKSPVAARPSERSEARPIVARRVQTPCGNNMQIAGLPNVWTLRVLFEMWFLATLNPNGRATPFEVPRRTFIRGSKPSVRASGISMTAFYRRFISRQLWEKRSYAYAIFIVYMSLVATLQRKYVIM